MKENWEFGFQIYHVTYNFLVLFIDLIIIMFKFGIISLLYSKTPLRGCLDMRISQIRAYHILERIYFRKIHYNFTILYIPA